MKSALYDRATFLGLGGAAAAALLPGAAGQVPTDLDPDRPNPDRIVATDALPLRWEAKISADMPAPRTPSSTC